MTESPTAAIGSAATAGSGEVDTDVPPFRYTAELAGRLEQHWQHNWQRWGTFDVPNPVGSLAPADG